jgi:NMD protein affecting ribosome stability and mRNA decay
MALKGTFCAKCGIEDNKLVSNLCAECFFALNEIKVPKTKELGLCSKCGSIRVDHFWIEVEKQNREEFSDQVKSSIKVPDEVKILKVDLIKIKPDGLMEVTYDIGGNILVKEYKCALRVKKQLCPKCKIDARTDYKAKIQIRTKGDVSKVVHESLEFLRKYKKSIMKIEEIRTGLDVHFRSRQDALRVAHPFKQTYKCHMKETREEYSWNRAKNKPKYKSTFLLTKQ